MLHKVSLKTLRCHLKNTFTRIKELHRLNVNTRRCVDVFQDCFSYLDQPIKNNLFHIFADGLLPQVVHAHSNCEEQESFSNLCWPAHLETSLTVENLWECPVNRAGRVKLLCYCFLLSYFSVCLFLLCLCYSFTYAAFLPVSVHRECLYFESLAWFHKICAAALCRSTVSVGLLHIFNFKSPVPPKQKQIRCIIMQLLCVVLSDQLHREQKKTFDSARDSNWKEGLWNSINSALTFRL